MEHFTTLKPYGWIYWDIDDYYFCKLVIDDSVENPNLDNLKMALCIDDEKEKVLLSLHQIKNEDGAIKKAYDYLKIQSRSIFIRDKFK